MTQDSIPADRGTDSIVDPDCPDPVPIDTGHGPAGNGGSQPQKMSSPSGVIFAVKFINNPQGSRVLFNEQVVGRLAERLEMPCAQVSVVDVSADAASGISFGGTPAFPGPSHGSHWLEDVDQVGNLSETLDVAGNHERLTELMVLFTVVMNTDPQYVQQTGAGRHIYSVDHGHALGGNSWTKEILETAPLPIAFESPVGAPTLDAATLTKVRRSLELLTRDEVNLLVGCVPAEWGLREDEREAAATFIWARALAVIALIPEDEADAA